MTLPVTGDPASDRWVYSVLGCEWGRDFAPCGGQAVHFLVLHHGERELAVKLCARHCNIMLANMTAYKFEE